MEDRARAYLDVNCSHCHNAEGFAAGVNLELGYGTPFGETGIDKRKAAIRRAVTERDMPKIGTTILHDEGVALIQAYIDQLD